MAARNTTKLGTAFTVSIEAAEGAQHAILTPARTKEVEEVSVP